MRKIWILVLAMLIGAGSFAQKKSGTVFIEHEAIEKTKALWKAFTSGDKEGYSAMLSDSAVMIFNGDRKNRREKEWMVNGVDWFQENFENMEMVDDKPAYPDAIEYDGSGTWVQDWVVMKGRHKETGINLNHKVHHLYLFDDEGKIRVIFNYSDGDVFDEIQNSQTTKENGKVYINHPYIIKVRKLINAYTDEDIEAMEKFYAPNARFSDATMKFRESRDLETIKKEWQERFDAYDLEMEQIGYPDCIYYAKNDVYAVYSWWIHKSTDSEGNVTTFPIMLTHNFNKEGKIVRGMAYFSSNHFE